MGEGVLAGVIGVAFGILQRLLLRRLRQTRTVFKRVVLAVLMALLWALATGGLALWWGTDALPAFLLASVAAWLAMVAFDTVRARRAGRHQE